MYKKQVEKVLTTLICDLDILLNKSKKLYIRIEEHNMIDKQLDEYDKIILEKTNCEGVELFINKYHELLIEGTTVENEINFLNSEIIDRLERLGGLYNQIIKND